MASQPGDIHILHVDDESDFAELTAHMLEREDDRFTVETATNASEGLDLLAADDFDCIVSDYDMPGQNGIEFLETVRDEHSDLPFILYTGKGSEEIASDAISAGANDYLQKGRGTDQYELLANRIQNTVEQYRTTQRAAELDRIRTLASNIHQALVRADSRSEAETQVCEIISESDPYLFAWIGEVDSETDRIEPRAWAGVEEGYLDDITVTADDTATGQGPGGTAVRERRLAVSQNIQNDPEFEQWREDALIRGYRAFASVPLDYEGTLFGVLGVYAARPHAFDENQRELLMELGNDISHAIHSFEIQDRLRAERDRRRALFENAPVPVIAGDIREKNNQSTHIIGDANDEFEKVFGFETEDIVGKDPAEMIVPNDRMDRHERLKERTDAGKSNTAEVERITAKGRREFLVQAIPYEAEKGYIDGWYAWYTDITTRKERERELERYETILEAIGDPVYALDEDGHYTFVNDAFVEETGYSRSDILGRHVSAIISDESQQKGREVIRELLRDDERKSGVYETERTKASGESYEAEINVALLPFDDEFRGTAGVVRDISDRKRRERELQRQNDRLDEFASIVSHDLRNPLHVAEGNLELAREDCNSEYLDAVGKAHDRMDALIEDLLTLSQKGEKISTTEPVDLRRIAGKSWRTVETDEANLVNNLSRSVESDKGRLRQVFENLFRNAVEHGGLDVTITVGEMDNGFYVEDDGFGIPEDDREDVFNAGYSTSEAGTGFGLQIVKQIIEAHDWDISVMEGSEGGARFEITGVGFSDE